MAPYSSVMEYQKLLLAPVQAGTLAGEGASGAGFAGPGPPECLVPPPVLDLQPGCTRPLCTRPGLRPPAPSFAALCQGRHQVQTRLLLLLKPEPRSAVTVLTGAPRV